MPRGGYREGAGGKSTWRHGKTKVIRVPEALSEQILEYARTLDQNPDSICDREIDLSGVNLQRANNEYSIKLSSLINLGYIIKPNSLGDTVLQDIYRKSMK
ncbi:MAG: hypothetical protein AAF652_18045 [Cyanobacteria bacterium P01_C01_bin.72]